MSYDIKKGESQIKNLTPNHKCLEDKGQIKFDWSVFYTIGKILLKVIWYCLHIFKKNWFEKYMNL
jgi:hypothetical protein